LELTQNKARRTMKINGLFDGISKRIDQLVDGIVEQPLQDNGDKPDEEKWWRRRESNPRA